MKRRRRRGFTLVVLVVAAGAVVACGAGAATTATAPKPKLVAWCATKTERKAAIRFRATDGARLVGVLLGPRTARSGVVLAHEAGDDAGLCNWIRYGRALSRAGYRVLAFDARGSFSSPRFRAAPFRRDFDVAGATLELRRRGVARVVLVGGSLGAMASLAAGAVVDPPVSGVAAVSPALEFGGLDALAAMPRLRVPLLLVAAEQDREFARYAQTLYDAAATADKQLVLFPGAEHGYQLVWPLRPGKALSVVDAFVRSRLRA